MVRLATDENAPICILPMVMKALSIADDKLSVPRVLDKSIAHEGTTPPIPITGCHAGRHMLNGETAVS